MVVEKEVLEFADQQGLHVKEYPTTISNPVVVEQAKPLGLHFETKYMDYVTDHPLIFLGVPSLGFLYGAVLETALDSNFSGAVLSTAARFAVSLADSPLFIASVALSIGSAILYSQKKILAKIKDSTRETDRL